MQKNINEFHEETGFISVNNNGHLEFDSFDCVDLAQKFGTPLYVITKKKLLENYAAILNSFRDIYSNTEIVYALKANPILKICKIIYDAGGMVEIGSFGELFLANLTGISPSKIIYNGNFKPREHQEGYKDGYFNKY